MRYRQHNCGVARLQECIFIQEPIRQGKPAINLHAMPCGGNSSPSRREVASAEVWTPNQVRLTSGGAPRNLPIADREFVRYGPKQLVLHIRFLFAVI